MILRQTFKRNDLKAYLFEDKIEYDLNQRRCMSSNICPSIGISSKK